jgi:hypothetical protein
MTITVADDLVERLRAQAEARQLSVQQWALVILANASERPDHPETWTELNERRLALIRQRYAAGLNEREEQELDALQDAAAIEFEPADRGRLEYLQTLIKEAARRADE